MVSEYQISVVTPFHNVDLDVFQNACRSMLNQTIGFENIEWIVVVHNSDPAYLEGVRNLLGACPNVTIAVLNNDRRTPSSPRNYGMKLASAPYIGFLDGDDSYLPDCLLTALSHMKKTGAQITWFRREFELESDDAMPVTEIVLWDQTREEIIVDQDHWDNEKIFSGVCGMVTSRIYDRRFLTENGIVFDESVPFGEDYLFNLEAYGHVERVCYLPQHIGYHYYINGASLVQERNKSAETLKTIARGYQKIFDTGLRYGFYMAAIMSDLCFMIATFMASSNALRLEDRIEIKDILAPYLAMMTPMKASKLYSDKKTKERDAFLRDVILHPENWSDHTAADLLVSADAQNAREIPAPQAVLRDILEENSHTDMGRRYEFSDIMTVSGYQSKLPVSNYDAYYPLIRLQTNIGEYGIFSADRICGYALTSGTFGTPKIIPCTEKQLKPYVDLFAKTVNGCDSLLLFESLPQKKRYNDKAYLNTITGMVLEKYFASPQSHSDETRGQFSAPSELLFPGEIAELGYARLLFGLADERVEQIIAPFTWGIAESFGVMEKQWETLCTDIENGTLNGMTGVSLELRKRLEGRMHANPERAAELRRVFAEGFARPIAKRIWPKLRRAVAAGSGAFACYTERLKRYLGDVPCSNGAYACSEALLGVAVAGTDDYRLCRDGVFVEFCEEDGTQGRIVTEEETRCGCAYSPVITTYSGLYRYHIEDIIRIRSRSNEELIFTFEGRKNRAARLGTCALSDGQVYSALLKLAAEAGFELGDYAYMADHEERCFTVIAEPISADGVFACMPVQTAQVLDELLAGENEVYRCGRESGALQSVKLYFGQPETHLLYRDVERYRRQTAPDQIKPVHLLDNPIAAKFFLGRIL